MSPSEPTQVRLKADTTAEVRLKADTTAEVRLKADTTAVVALLEQMAGRTDLHPDDVRAVMSAATRLYANASTQAGRELPPPPRGGAA